MPRLWISPRDIGLFVRSARTDSRIARLRPTLGLAGALEAVYAADSDPWASASPRFQYQRLKYRSVVALLPAGRFRNVLDLGCGLGLLSRHLAPRADALLGIDIAPSAIAHARLLNSGQTNTRFEVGDLLELPAFHNGRYDLLAICDVLYYLQPLDKFVLTELAARVSELLVPGGLCLLVDHFFFGLDAESRRSRRIHEAFGRHPSFTVHSEHRRAFYLTTLLRKASG